MVGTKTCFTVVGFFKLSHVKTHYKRPRCAQKAQGASNRDITECQQIAGQIDLKLGGWTHNETP